MSQVGPSRTKDSGSTSIRAQRKDKDKVKSKAQCLSESAGNAHAMKACMDAKASIMKVICRLDNCNTIVHGDHKAIANHIANHHEAAIEKAEGTKHKYVCTWLECQEGFSTKVTLVRHVQNIHIKQVIKCKMCKNKMRLEKSTYLRHTCMQDRCFLCWLKVGKGELEDHFATVHGELEVNSPAPSMGTIARDESPLVDNAELGDVLTQGLPSSSSQMEYSTAAIQEELEVDPPAPYMGIVSWDESPVSDGAHSPAQLSDSVTQRFPPSPTTLALQVPVTNSNPNSESHVVYDTLDNTTMTDVIANCTAPAGGDLPTGQQATTRTPSNSFEPLPLEDLIDFSMLASDDTEQGETGSSQGEVGIFDGMAGFDPQREYMNTYTNDENHFNQHPIADTDCPLFGVPSTAAHFWSFPDAKASGESFGEAQDTQYVYGCLPPQNY